MREHRLLKSEQHLVTSKRERITSPAVYCSWKLVYFHVDYWFSELYQKVNKQVEENNENETIDSEVFDKKKK